MRQKSVARVSLPLHKKCFDDVFAQWPRTAELQVSGQYCDEVSHTCQYTKMFINCTKPLRGAWTSKQSGQVTMSPQTKPITFHPEKAPASPFVAFRSLSCDLQRWAAATNNASVSFLGLHRKHGLPYSCSSSWRHKNNGSHYFAMTTAFAASAFSTSKHSGNCRK